jgi:hypothetical protein
LPVVSDSYMGVFMPADIIHRISQFVSGMLDFPYVKSDETMAAFYLFGKDYRVHQSEVRDVEDLAKKAVEQVAKDVRLYTSAPSRMDANFTRENYTKRSLQIAVDNAGIDAIHKRVAGDPAILSDCFAQHIAFHRQGYYFELFQPFKEAEIPASLKHKLEGRMLLLGFNAKDRESLPFRNILDLFFDWMIKAG